VCLYGEKQMSTGVRRIMRLRGSEAIKNSLSVAPYYQWRSDHELILLRVKEAGGSGGASGGNYSMGRGFYFVRLDMRTRKETPLTELNKRFLGDTHRMIGYWRLSPDRNWLFWPEYKSQHA